MFTDKLRDTKLRLLATLKDYNFDTKKDEVVEVVNELSALWRESLAFSTEKDFVPSKSNLFIGEWKMISAPQFPGRIFDENKPDKFQYTLGRVSFNLFEPRKAVVTILHPEGVKNYVHEISGEEDKKKCTYNLLSQVVVHTEDGDLPAELLMEGYCFPETEYRLKIGFYAGTLRKSPKVDKVDILSKRWHSVFDGIYANAEGDLSYGEIAMRWISKKMLDMTMPSDKSMKFEMKRVFHGYLDILFLDEDMRITIGNRGSIVITVKD